MLYEVITYPNPTSYGYVNISSRNQAVLEVGVFDIMGKRILQETVNHNLLDRNNFV